MWVLGSEARFSCFDSWRCGSTFQTLRESGPVLNHTQNFPQTSTLVESSESFMVQFSKVLHTRCVPWACAAAAEYEFERGCFSCVPTGHWKWGLRKGRLSMGGLEQKETATSQLRRRRGARNKARENEKTK